MRLVRTPVLCFVLPAFLGACAGSGGSGTQAPRDYNVITLAEIEASQAETAYQLIQQLRPRWMTRNRGERTFAVDEADYAKVIVDEFPPREFDYLRELRRETLQELRFLEPREATFLYGTGYNAGVIQVTTRR
jgi:hypothetical protein